MATIPERLPDESARAFDAFGAYCRLGPERSVEKLAQTYPKSIPLLKRWCRLHAWVERTKQYDQALAEAAAVQHRARYLVELEQHRKKSMDSARGLYAVAGRLLAQLNEQASRAPQVIIGQDGKRYEISPDMSFTMLMVIARAFLVSLDIEAHALGIDQLLPRLEPVAEPSPASQQGD